MMKHRNLFLYIIALFIVLSSASCSKSGSSIVDTPTTPPEETGSLNITDIAILPLYNHNATTNVQITGKGFEIGDIIVFNSTDNPSISINTTITSIEADHIVVRVPNSVADGRYRIIVRRGTASQILGASIFTAVLRPDLPDQSGKSIKGVIHVGGTGLADVVVSDGDDVTKTDQNGVYYLSSNKRTGYVFVSIPGNYEVKAKNGNLPQFYKYVRSAPDIVETVDFELTPVNNENHIILGMADFHLANRTNDLLQYQAFLNDINSVITDYKATGKKVYGLTLGDLTWETYWYSRNFALPQYIEQINRVNDIPIFNVMGNHDNDPYFASDWMAENAYRDILGPTYYAFNIGKVHYIVLDNTEYVNTGGAPGISGDRSYNAKVSDQQMAWLTKHLETVEPSTPIVLAMHIQLNNAPNAAGTATYRIDNATQLISTFNRFEKVHVLTGHTHTNHTVERNGGKIIEHNIAAVCATWWWTGSNNYAGNHISPDGSPGGYGVWEMNGTDIKWHYKSIGYDKEYQFRSYDLNNVHITKAAYAPNATDDAQVVSRAQPFHIENNNNEVLINVWGYDPQWGIKVTVEGSSTELPWTRVQSRDPLHIISFPMIRLNAGGDVSFNSSNTSHMFKVTAPGPNTNLEITVTDRFGNTYTENMVRPKAFNTSMR